MTFFFRVVFLQLSELQKIGLVRNGYLQSNMDSTALDLHVCSVAINICVQEESMPLGHEPKSYSLLNFYRDRAPLLLPRMTISANCLTARAVRL